MIPDLIARLRALDLLKTSEMPGDEWAAAADAAMQEAAEVLSKTHEALLAVSEEIGSVLRSKLAPH